VGVAKRGRTAVAGSQRLILALETTAPDRPDGMDDMARGKPIAGGDFGIAGGAAFQGSALGQ
jgi:hypothetical protein